MKKQTKSVLNNNIDFIQLKLFDFSKEKIDHKKIISKRLNKHPKIQNTNQKLFLDENNIFKYNNPICPVCGSHKIIKKGTITKNKQISMEKTQNSKNNNINAKNVTKNLE